MKDTYIFVEGDSDERFLQAVFLRYYADGGRAQFISLGGSYRRLEEEKRIEQLKDGRRNLVIVDADVKTFRQVKSGVQALLDRIAGEQGGRDIPFQAESFLFPDDKSDGNLESLVRRLTPKNKEGVWNKTKIYIYVNAHYHVKWNSQEWMLETEIWNLESKTLNNLLAFLDKYFTRKK